MARQPRCELSLSALPGMGNLCWCPEFCRLANELGLFIFCRAVEERDGLSQAAQIGGRCEVLELRVGEGPEERAHPL
ncbi:protein of unknown function [Hyphomicrobium sp. MC1]|nr:protein of unknown function [Hyphomicrobium sp. MC1]